MSTCGKPTPTRRCIACGIHLLPDVEHRRFVALALTDDDAAVNRHGIHDASHRFDSGLVGPMPIALAHGLRAGNRSFFNDAKEFERSWSMIIDSPQGSSRRSDDRHDSRAGSLPASGCEFHACLRKSPRLWFDEATHRGSSEYPFAP